MKLFNHWVLQRITAVILIPLLLGLLYTFINITNNTWIDVYNGTNIVVLLWELVSNSTIINYIALLICFGTILIHIIEGLENIVLDYVQNKELKNVIFKGLNIIGICLFKCLCVYLLLL